MTTSELIVAIIIFVIAGLLLVFSIRSFMNKGFLLNNAYLYASKEEMEKMDKKPYYIQTAVVFLLLSIVFFIIGLSVVFQDSRIDLLEIPFVAGTIVYAVLSTIRIRKRGR